MGFGYLLLGFIIWLNPVHAELSEWLAYTLMLAGTTKLSPYGKGFKISNYIGIPALVLSIISFIYGGLDLLGIAAYDSGALYNAVEFSLLIFGYAYKFAFLYGIYEITKYTGIEKQTLRSVYCMIVYALIFVFELLLTTKVIPPSTAGFGLVFFSSLTIGLVAFFLIFACLRMITLEGEDEQTEDIPKKQSWIKKLKQMSEEDN